MTPRAQSASTKRNDSQGPATMKAVKATSTRKKASGCMEERLFDALDVAIFIHEIGTGAILRVNRRMSELYGYSAEEAVQLDIGQLSIGLSPCSRTEAMEWMQKAAEEGPQRFEWLTKDRRGRPFWVEMSLRKIALDGQDRLLATARDISEQKRIESDQASRLKRAEAQNAVFLALAGVGADFQAAMDLITHHLAIHIGDLCVLEMLNDDGKLSVESISQPYLDGEPLLPQLSKLARLSIETPGAGVVTTLGESIRITDPSLAQILPRVRPEFHSYLKHFGIHSLVIVPMRAEHRSIGAITLVKGGSSRPYSAEDQAMLQSLADRSALAIINAKLSAENQQQAEALRLINAELENRVAQRTAELGEANRQLQRLAIEDALTGLSNRRRFNEVMDEEVRRATRSKEPLGLVLCDVDFFKKFNDHYGHQGGDDCLRAVGKTMLKIFRRAGELPARYGGEEFAVVLPNHTPEQTLAAAERLRASIEALGLPHAKSDAAPCVTISLGVVSASAKGHDASWFIERADEALYRSKASGRNRATLAVLE